MDVGQVINRIDRYLSDCNGYPLLVNVQVSEDLTALLDHYRVPGNIVKYVGDFCSLDDELVSWPNVLNLISHNDGNIFISGVSPYLKLQGKREASKILFDFLGCEVDNPVVVFLLRCENFIHVDPISRMGRNFLLVDSIGIESEPFVNFVGRYVDGSGMFNGLREFGRIEEKHYKEVYLYTRKKPEYFCEKIFNIRDFTSSFKMLESKFNRFNVNESVGTEEEWAFVWKESEKFDNFEDFIAEVLGDTNSLESALNMWNSFDEKKKWLLFFALKNYGICKNHYLRDVVNSSNSFDEFKNHIYTQILLYSYGDSEFPKMYSKRKIIIGSMGLDVYEMSAFLNELKIKGERDFIYYLTDLSQLEKEAVIEWVAKFGKEMGDKLKSILQKVYPALASYLEEYAFGNEWLDSMEYVQQYKKCKLFNEISPEFLSLVEEQAEKREYNLKLQTRMAVLNSVNLKDSQAYFVDAMGIEFVGYIVNKCRALDLWPSVKIARCNLPSLTPFNKDFVECFTQNGCGVIDIKDLDVLKHHPKDKYNYEKTKLPIHLVKELKIFDELMEKIKTSLYCGNYAKAILISDHGASRLAVIHESENKWEMQEKGLHGGRCCPANEMDEKPKFATCEDGYYVLANYDCFKGGRKAAVEVHGGASIEEVAVPIIEIIKKPAALKVYLVDKEIKIESNKSAIIKIFVSIENAEVSVRVRDAKHVAKPVNEHVYKCTLDNVKSSGDYDVEILVDGNFAEKEVLHVKTAGMSKKNLFGRR